ncbi:MULTISPECIES: TolC family outer membrane protein [unclassified Marinobacterium]|uniref:TolC family outer membrane protein n=1 Tax=unclassified Marinobacterium TaxID=2644139 RepID=UPI00156836EA|nr:MULTISPECIES: TolC family outer membrane protein [unclassified Marinobacterium]NRP09818.1 Outer membrane protein TolC precursor [Marinobacterium sp. xm-g-48]NRP82663.1 Outer membrane protein TolC precursor [Marinobacterium sp. xm-d-509]
MNARFTKQSLAISIATLISASTQAGVLTDLYNSALKNDASYQESRALALATNTDYDIALAELYPSAAIVGTSTKSEPSGTTTNGLALSISQDLFNMSAWYGYKAAKQIPEITQLSIEAADQGLMFRLVSTYLGALKAKNGLEVAEAQERALKRRLDQVNAQFEVGLIAITDVLEARASYDDARASLFTAQSGVESALDSLEKMTGVSSVDLKKIKASYPIEGITEGSESEWVEKALAGNIALRLKKLSEVSAGYKAEAYASAHYPTVELSHSAFNGENDYEQRNGDSSTRLTLTIPIFSGFATTANQDKYAYKHTEALFAYEGEVKTVKADTRKLLRDIEASVKTVEARKVALESREKALEATSQGFEVGTRNIVDVLNAETALYAAKTDYAEARIDHIALVTEMKSTLGTLSPADIESLDSWLEG